MRPILLSVIQLSGGHCISIHFFYNSFNTPKQFELQAFVKSSTGNKGRSSFRCRILTRPWRRNWMEQHSRLYCPHRGRESRQVAACQISRWKRFRCWRTNGRGMHSASLCFERRTFWSWDFSHRNWISNWDKRHLRENGVALCCHIRSKFYLTKIFHKI